MSEPLSADEVAAIERMWDVGYTEESVPRLCDDWRRLTARVEELEAENARLKTCLADADSFMLGGDLKLWNDFKAGCGLTQLPGDSAKWE